MFVPLFLPGGLKMIDVVLISTAAYCKLVFFYIALKVKLEILPFR